MCAPHKSSVRPALAALGALGPDTHEAHNSASRRTTRRRVSRPFCFARVPAPCSGVSIAVTAIITTMLLRARADPFNPRTVRGLVSNVPFAICQSLASGWPADIVCRLRTILFLCVAPRARATAQLRSCGRIGRQLRFSTQFLLFTKCYASVALRRFFEFSYGTFSIPTSMLYKRP